MKNFIIKVFFFCLSPLVILFISFIIKQKITHNKLKNIGLENTILLMGDSQMRRVDPSLFSINAKNLASSGEHFFFSYEKLKLVLDANNHQIRYLLLSVSSHSFAPVYSRLLDLDKNEGSASLKNSLFFLEDIKMGEYETIDLVLHPGFYKSILSPIDWGGHYKSTNAKHSEDVVKKVASTHYVSTALEKYDYQLPYLQKIIDLCSDHEIQVILVSLPVHNNYKSRIPEKYINTLKSNIESLSKANKIIYIDYFTSETPESLLSDPNHLNAKGTDIYSDSLSLFIKKIENNE